MSMASGADSAEDDTSKAPFASLVTLHTRLDANEWHVSKSRDSCRHQVLQNMNVENHITASRDRQPLEASTSCFDWHAAAILQAMQKLTDILCTVQLARHATVA